MYINIWMMLFLLLCTMTDLRERKIIMPVCFINAVVALAVNLLVGEISWMSLFGGMFLGAVFYVISIISKEALGKGDAVMIFTIGCIGGVETTVSMVTWSFLLCILISAAAILLRKAHLKSRLPFAPFMLLGGLITFALGGL